MIVLSILTALGLERAAVYAHDRSAAQDSRERIDHELQVNAADLREVIALNRANLELSKDRLTVITAALKAGSTPEAAALAGVASLGLDTNTWQRTAWDAAIADQSASHLSAIDLERYASVYAEAADLKDTIQLVLGGDWLSRAAEVDLDAKLGRPDARQQGTLLIRIGFALQQALGGETDLLAHIDGTPVAKLPAKPAASPPAPSDQAVPTPKPQ